MRPRQNLDRRCAYVVVLDHPYAGNLRELASYLSDLGVAKCEVIVVDDSPNFERNRRVLCWVARHVAPQRRHRNAAGLIEPVRAAMDLTSCEKIIVADANVRYSPQALEELCAMLDVHEAVEPQDYFEPMPWWSGIDAGRMLVDRGIEPAAGHGATFAFRKSAARALDFTPGSSVFVRRLPPRVSDWVRERPRLAGADFSFPFKTAFFLALLPLALLLAAFGGPRLAGTYTGMIAFGAFALAVRGRAGAAAFFPLRACLFAPLSVFERSVSVYWALLRKLGGSELIARGETPEDLQPTAHIGAR